MNTFSQDQGGNQSIDQLTFKVGEREFNAESAATKIQAADTHISTIESENQSYKDRVAALEVQLAQSTKIEDALASFQKQEPQDSQPAPDTSGVSEEQIGAIASKQIEDYLAKQRAEQAQADSIALAETTFKSTGVELVKMYGDDVDKAVKAKATELGISENDMYNMAKSPAQAKMLLEFMKVPQPANQSAPSGGFNTHGLHNQAPEKFVDYSKGVTSSIVMEALAKAGGNYQI